MGKKKKKKPMPLEPLYRRLEMELTMKRFLEKHVNIAFEQDTHMLCIARYLKRVFEDQYGPPWHCIVGTDFGTNVDYIYRHYAYFFINNTAVLLFKT